MELDRNQPSGNGLREALAPWFDHSAAWLVLLCLALTVFAAVTRIATDGPTRLVASDRCRVARRHLARLARVGTAWHLATIGAAPGAGSRSRCSRSSSQRSRCRCCGRSTCLPCRRSPICSSSPSSPARRSRPPGFLLSTRGKAFGPQFWLEATLVALCVGTVLWLALPHDLRQRRAARRAAPGRSASTR